MPTLICVCGPPASGKTTLAKRWEAEGRGTRVAPDDYRDTLREKYSAEANSLVFKRAKTQTEGLLRSGEDVLFDSCVLTDKARWTLYTLGKKHGAEVRWVLLDEPWETLKERNEARERTVPEPTLRAMYDQFQQVKGSFPSHRVLEVA
jgi:predicted kinase